MVEDEPCADEDDTAATEELPGAMEDGETIWEVPAADELADISEDDVPGALEALVAPLDVLAAVEDVPALEAPTLVAPTLVAPTLVAPALVAPTLVVPLVAALDEARLADELRGADVPVDRDEPDMAVLVPPVRDELPCPTEPEDVAPPAAQLPSTQVAPSTQSVSVSHTFPGITAVQAPRWTSRANPQLCRQNGVIGCAA